MPKRKEVFDYAVIGGGLFGCYAALYLYRRGLRVCLIEKEKQLLRKASLVNQARLHGGYHYPRSVATARMSDENKARFTAEHRPFINFDFKHYYAIDRYGSFTDPQQFERFCEYVRLPCRRVNKHPLFRFQRMEALYETTEYSFDPVLIGDYYRRQIQKAEDRLSLYRHCHVISAAAVGQGWELQLSQNDGQPYRSVQAQAVINATYTAGNAVNQLFGSPSIQLMHEISEIALLSSPPLQSVGLTVMDGPFASLMPYGCSGLLSLSSVAYTHHKISYEDKPRFDCQEKRPDCRPGLPADCNYCPVRPRSNFTKMEHQIRQYLTDGIPLHYYRSLFTIKSKLKASHIDDSRPTEISILRENPRFYCIFAGKINSIYEIEKVLPV